MIRVRKAVDRGHAAPVLALGCTSLNFVRNGKPNAAAVHDLGLASGSLVLEATSRGLFVHQMIGILPDRARELYLIPDGFRPLTALPSATSVTQARCRRSTRIVTARPGSGIRLPSSSSAANGERHQTL